MAKAEIAALWLAIGDELTGPSNRRGFEMLGDPALGSEAAADAAMRAAKRAKKAGRNGAETGGGELL